ncbi:helix-turn-helix domain-containing protein [Methylobacterium gnaphalii]|uniref:Helix-turn-helix domain-containing protein n=1 Tax=Methylobacterium gnaphalii TaxID=1010610 RepID=A0A512JRF1_9HYPH|nr:helix-turn-helix domain-containing protein [Methylobacterium gnaphalii]GEP12529.1 hypothetical protein MGN01_43740 [Methylobacterium gnaphalii]GJD70198.1 hypothetical protein MMMDOFMJ_3140 [Methylobacterium gnaphalii]
MHAAPKPDTEPLLTESEAADLLSISIRTLQGWRYAGTAPRHSKLGRIIRYRRADLASYVETRAPAAQGDAR